MKFDLKSLISGELIIVSDFLRLINNKASLIKFVIIKKEAEKII